jgi:hypothetical protein
MKTSLVLRTLALGLAVVLCLPAAPAAKTNDRVQVVFFEPDRFTDVKDSYMGTEKGQAAILDQIRDYVQERAAKMLGDGQTLTVTFTDIDLAGDYEPGRGPRSDEIRLVKEIYPPRIDLSFKVTDANGEVIKQGERKLRDMAFLMKLSINTSDSLRFEKSLLDDWMRDDLRRLK